MLFCGRDEKNNIGKGITGSPGCVGSGPTWACWSSCVTLYSHWRLLNGSWLVTVKLNISKCNRHEPKNGHLYFKVLLRYIGSQTFQWTNVFKDLHEVVRRQTYPLFLRKDLTSSYSLWTVDGTLHSFYHLLWTRDTPQLTLRGTFCWFYL